MDLDKPEKFYTVKFTAKDIERLIFLLIIIALVGAIYVPRYVESSCKCEQNATAASKPENLFTKEELDAKLASQQKTLEDGFRDQLKEETEQLEQSFEDKLELEKARLELTMDQKFLEQEKAQAAEEKAASTSAAESAPPTPESEPEPAAKPEPEQKLTINGQVFLTLGKATIERVSLSKATLTSFEYLIENRKEDFKPLLQIYVYDDQDTLTTRTTPEESVNLPSVSAGDMAEDKLDVDISFGRIENVKTLKVQLRNAENNQLLDSSVKKFQP